MKTRPAARPYANPLRTSGPSAFPPRAWATLPLAALLAAAAVGTSACSTNWIPYFARPYRPDIQQGNIITQEMVEQLRPGMTEDQVRFLLGTPMLRDIFHQDRWDYPYYLQRGDGSAQLRKLTVFFDHSGRLARFQSDKMPTETEADKLIIGKKAK